MSIYLDLAFEGKKLASGPPPGRGLGAPRREPQAQLHLFGCEEVRRRL